MRQYYFFILLFFNQQLFSFSSSHFLGQDRQLFCTLHELVTLFTNQQDFKILLETSDTDTVDRLKLLQKHKSKLLWHLLHPMVGVYQAEQVSSNFSYQTVAWNFSLWELAPKKGAGSKIAIIDHFNTVNFFDKNPCLYFLSNLTNDEKNNFIDQPYCGLAKDSLKQIYEAGFFYSAKKNILKHHGLLSCNVIKQLSPHCTIIPVSAVDEFGFSDKKILSSALEKVLTQDINFVHLGLKITSNTDTYNKEVEQLINKIPYVVAASGNSTDGIDEAFPANIETVPFDVGAFFIKDNKHKICNFSQYSLNKGPKLVAPGQDLFCSYDGKHFSMVHGTSFASAIITGFLSLVLAEFQEDFSYQEILQVMYQSVRLLGNDHEWKDKVLLGAIDMRSCLLCFHVLKYLKQHLSCKTYKRQFNKMVRIIYLLEEFCEREFREEFLIFVKNIKPYAIISLIEHVEALAFLVTLVCGICIDSDLSKKKFDMSLVKLLKNSIDLHKKSFHDLPKVAQRRLDCAIYKKRG